MRSVYAPADMGEAIAELSTVRVVRMTRAREEYGVIRGGRAPSVGEEGVVVMVQELAGRYGYTVECVRPDGTTEWLAAFEADEVELVE